MPRNSKASVIGVAVMGLILLVGSFITYFALTRSNTAGISPQVLLPPFNNEIGTGQQTFTLKRIAVNFENSCETLEIKINGEAKQIECDDTYLENRKLLSNELIEKLFGTLTKESFLKLGTKYYAPNLSRSLTITLETNFGTKVIVISNTDNTAPQITDELGEIIDELEDVEEEINLPDPSPPPSIPPTPTPTPGSSGTPLPSNLPTPTPTVTPTLAPGVTPEPFRCDMLEDQGVTVSSIRCLEEDDF